jgi:hypothetical protein
MAAATDEDASQTTAQLGACIEADTCAKVAPPFSNLPPLTICSCQLHQLQGKGQKRWLTCWWGSWRVKVAAEPSCHDWGQRLS